MSRGPLLTPRFLAPFATRIRAIEKAIDEKSGLAIDSATIRSEKQPDGRIQLHAKLPKSAQPVSPPPCPPCPPDAETITLILAGLAQCADVSCCIHPIAPPPPNGVWTLTRSSANVWLGTLDGNFFAQVTCSGILTVFVMDEAGACTYFVGEGCPPGPIPNEITDCGESCVTYGYAAFGGTAMIA